MADDAFTQALRCFEEFLARPAAIDVAQVDYHRARDLAAAVFDKLQPIRAQFVSACLGRPYNDVPSETLSFPDRFLGRHRALSPQQLQELRALVESSFDLGLLYHLMFNQFPTRPHSERVDLDTLFLQWAPESLVADVLSRDYDRGNSSIPSTVQRAFAKLRVEPFLKGQLAFGFWARAKANSWFRNTFFAGVRLGLFYDLATKEVQYGGA